MVNVIYFITINFFVFKDDGLITHCAVILNAKSHHNRIGIAGCGRAMRERAIALAMRTYEKFGMSTLWIQIRIGGNNNMKNRIFKKALSMLLMVCLVAAFAPMGMTDVWAAEITVSDATSLTNALNTAADGDIIKLAMSIDYAKGITISGKDITFDLNGFILNVSNWSGPGLEVTNGGSVALAGSGEFDVAGTDYGVSVRGGATATVTSAEARGVSGGTGVWAYGAGSTVNVEGSVTTRAANSIGVYAHNGGSITVDGYVQSASHSAYAEGTGSSIVVNGDVTAIGFAGYGAYAYDGGNITINGNVTGLDTDSYGAYAYGGGNITIDGDAQGAVYGAKASGTGSSVYIRGNAKGSNAISSGAMADNNGVITIDGYARGGTCGANAADDGSIVIVNGDAISTQNNGMGAYAEAGGTIEIGGSAAANGGGNSYGAHGLDGKIAISGNASGAFCGVYASGPSGEITVGADVDTTETGRWGVKADDGAKVVIDGNVKGKLFGVYSDGEGSTVDVIGDVTAISDSGFGACAYGGSVTVDGAITATNYVAVDGSVKNEGEYYIPTSKPNYHTYTQNGSTVWVKATTPPTANICAIGVTEYATLEAALAAVQSGQTIELLQNIDYNQGITISGKSITFDVGTFTLNVTNELGIGLDVTGGGDVQLSGTGNFNITGTTGVAVNAAGSATVTNATATGANGNGVYVYGVGSTVAVIGDAMATDANSRGVFVNGGGGVTIDGNAQGGSHGILAMNNSSISVRGNSQAIGENGTGASAESGATIFIGADVTAQENGASGVAVDGAGSSITVGGNISASDVGTYTRDGRITVGGNIMVTAEGNGIGAIVYGSGEITVDGVITANKYLNINNVEKYNSADSRTIPSTKEGYHMYTDAQGGTVWVKAVDLLPVADALISPETMNFDKNPANQADVSTTITWNDAVSVTDVKKAEISVGAAAYTVSGNTLTINKEYLALQQVGSLMLAIAFDKGNTAALTIEISDTTPPIGSNPPTWPEGSTLTAVSTTKTTTVLSWTSAVDDVSVTAYRIYRDNSLIHTVTGAVHSYEAAGLTSSTTYIFRIQAGDADNNWTYGPTATVRTDSSVGGGGGGGGGGDRDDTPASVQEPKLTAQVLGSDSKIVESIIARLDRSNGTVTVEVDAASLTSAFDKSKTDEKGVKSISVNIPGLAGAKAYETILPVSFLTSGDTMKTIEIKTGIAAVTVPGNMITSTSSGGQNASLIIAAGDKSILTAEVQAQIGSRPVIELSLRVGGQKVSWNNESVPVTVTVPYTPTADELKDPEHITVWYIDSSGNAVAVPSGRYDQETGKVTFSTTHFSKYAVTSVYKTFNDISNYAWSKSQIEVLASKGIVRGASEQEYAPSGSITRADFLYSLVRTLGVDAKVEGNFDDISSDAYYYKEIGIAKKLGITTGANNNKFIPDASITRQDMMVLTERALRMLKKLKQQGTASDLEKFADKSLIAPYATDCIASVVKEGLIVGSGGQINPLGNTKRAEAAVILYRIYNIYK